MTLVSADHARRLVVGVARAGAVVLALASAACGTVPATSTGAVVIGATLPLTGRDAAQAAAMERGYARAVADANARGGITVGPATRPVRLDLRDDTSDSAALETLARSIIDAGAHVLIATPRAVRAAAEADVTERAGVILIGNAIDHPGLPGRRMQWMHVVATTTSDAEARAYEVATTTLRAIERAGTLEPRAILTALHDSAPPAAR